MAAITISGDFWHDGFLKIILPHVEVVIWMYLNNYELYNSIQTKVTILLTNSMAGTLCIKLTGCLVCLAFPGLLPCFLPIIDFVPIKLGLSKLVSW